MQGLLRGFDVARACLYILSAVHPTRLQRLLTVDSLPADCVPLPETQYRVFAKCVRRPLSIRTASV